MDAPPDARASPRKLRLCFDGCKGRALRIAALVHALDIWDQIELTDLSSQRPDLPQGAPLTAERRPHVQLITETGEVLTGYALFRKLTRLLRLLWPLALISWIPGPGKGNERRMTR